VKRVKIPRVEPGANRPHDAVEPRKVDLRYQIINGGCYLTFDGCALKSTLPENRGAPMHCAAGLPRDTVVTDDRTGQKLRVADGAVFAICPYSGMNEPGADGNRRVHWGNCESTCTHPLNSRSPSAEANSDQPHTPAIGSR
jgi:hypothetical protein